VGSSSTKGVLARADGTLVAEVERPSHISRPRPGRAEQDPEADWWAPFVGVCGELLGGRAHAVKAVAASGLGPCLAVADEHGRALRSAILYGIDTRAAAEVRELRERFGADIVLARCGAPLTSQSVGPKLAWVARHEPDVWARTRRWFTAGSYIVHRLTGEYVLDHYSASQCGPLYDLGANAWIAEWAEIVAPGVPLPRLAWAHEPLGAVNTAAAAETGLPAGTPVAGATVDSWGEVAASGLRSPGEALLVYGTTMFLAEVGTAAAPDRRLWSTASWSPGARNLAAGIGSAGALTAWLRTLAGDAPYDELFEEAAAAGPGAGGLVALPYFGGERTPLFDPDARGLILGLTLEHGRGHVLRALLEGAALAVRHNLDVMREAGAGVEALRASGGGARGGLWPAIVSDVTGLPQRILPDGRGAAYGDALLAALAFGAVAPGAGWARPGEPLEPRAETVALYDQLYEIYRELYPATVEQAHALARLQDDAAERTTTDGAGTLDGASPG
jgi:xylulokinase